MSYTSVSSARTTSPGAIFALESAARSQVDQHARGKCLDGILSRCRSRDLAPAAFKEDHVLSQDRLLKISPVRRSGQGWILVICKYRTPFCIGRYQYHNRRISLIHDRFFQILTLRIRTGLSETIGLTLYCLAALRRSRLRVRGAMGGMRLAELTRISATV